MIHIIEIKLYYGLIKVIQPIFLIILSVLRKKHSSCTPGCT